MNTLKFQKEDFVGSRTGDLFIGNEDRVYILTDIDGMYSAISLDDGEMWNSPCSEIEDAHNNGLQFLKRNATISIT